MGNTTSTPAISTPPAAAQEGCPVKHTSAPAAPEGCPVKHASAPAEEGCPVKHKTKVYNVYSQEIDPTNMMPANPNQEPKDGQKYPLETARVESTIPKGGTTGTWTYPSEQMFFNALRRKGKGEDVHEGQVQTIVSIHNNMNERAWHQVIEWENTLYPGSDSKLLRFCGRPDDLTPLARLKTFLGYGKPFDRHDWVVIRNDNSEHRYVIDYYFDEEKSKEDQVPRLHDVTSVKSISLYARPAIDDIGSLVDRIKFPLLSFLGSTAKPTLPEPAAPSSIGDDLDAKETLTVAEVEETFGKIKTSCNKCFTDVQMCADEVACAQAATALQFCMANILCKPDAVKFTTALASGDESRIEEAYASMESCVERFEERSRAAMQAQARVAAAQKANTTTSPSA
ncbi:Aste57867_11645 [Aphanomyces stellatus]|uniref:Holocytochrome c-type synthase n=1 Tax=Aphanomyces stellatus TaxID=120398 RepID=A0A485KTK4_9STRA|nr:hypothetical protein As57867_011602 [Aphanomyces stellatus]VFT88503.1 Aste57867_11645 [Aphanomyces stellatus]